jgi:hypothetical protein
VYVILTSRLQDALAHLHSADKTQRAVCNAGMARCTILTGDASEGTRLALQSGDKATMLECAALLETEAVGVSSLAAAEMYGRGGEFDKACALYIQNKAFARAEPLMAQVSSRKLLSAVRSLVTSHE